LPIYIVHTSSLLVSCCCNKKCFLSFFLDLARPPCAAYGRLGAGVSGLALIGLGPAALILSRRGAAALLKWDFIAWLWRCVSATAVFVRRSVGGRRR
jgi:hypothetical protein